MTRGQSAPSLGQDEIRCLTGLRGCAAVLVMCYHFTLGMPAGTIPMRQFFANGYLWVDLFFILSGFVLAYGQARRFSGAYHARTHLAFLASRIARVYPLYAVVIIESAGFLLWRTGHLDPAVLGLNLAMVQGWGLAPSLEGAAWSVSTEWGAYLLFPMLLGATLLVSRRSAWAVALLCMLALAGLAQAPGPFTLPGQGRHGPLDIYSSATAAPLLRCLAEFTLGLLSFRVADGLAAPGKRHAAVRRFSGALANAAAILLVAAFCLYGLDLAVVPLFCVLLVALSQQTGVLVGALASPLPYRLGRWSYSIYLIHDKFSHPAEAVRALLAQRLPFASVLTVLMAALLVIGCSGLTFAWVEQPLRRFVMAGLGRTRSARQEPVPASGLEIGT